MSRVPLASLRDARCAQLLLLACLLATVVVGAGCQSDPEARLAEIRAMQAAGQFDSSIQPLRVLLTTQSNHPEANYRLGVALMQTGRRSLAVWPLQKASESQEYAVQAGLLLASALLSTEAYEEAIRASDRVLAVDPERVHALYTRAHANIGAGRPADALADAERVLEIRPDDSQAFAIRTGALIDLERFEEAEESHKQLKARAEEALASGAAPNEDQAARACDALAMFYASRKRIEEARTTFDECLDTYPGHALTRQWASDFYARDGQPEKSFEIWRRAIEESPEDLSLRSKLADLLYSAGRFDEAEAVLIESAQLFDTRASWQLLASLYRKTGDPTKARVALEKAIERTRGDNETLRFTLGDLLVQEGELERAEEVAESLTEPSYRTLLRGAILLARDEPEAALELLETGLRLWPNNAGARYMAGQAALKMGDRERAMAEFREAVRTDETETEASLELARLYYGDGRFGPAQQFAERHVAKRPFNGPDAYVIAIRSAIETGHYEAADRLIGRLGAIEGQQRTAAIEYAALVRKRDGSEQAIEALRAAELDLTLAKNVAALRALTLDLVTVGRAEQALGEIDLAIAASPGEASLLDLKARVLTQLGRLDEARRQAALALEADPDYAPALEVMGSFAGHDGDLEKAIEYFDRAAEADPASGEYAYRAARLTQALGRNEDALQRLRDITERTPAHAAAANDLAWQLASRAEELDLALKLSERAVRLERSANYLDTLGWVLLQRGDSKAAIAALEAANALDEASASIQYRLGLALAREGETERAGLLLQGALDTGSFPEANEARTELARLKGQ